MISFNCVDIAQIISSAICNANAIDPIHFNQFSSVCVSLPRAQLHDYIPPLCPLNIFVFVINHSYD